MLKITFLNCKNYLLYMEKDPLETFLNTMFMGITSLEVIADDTVIITINGSNYIADEEINFMKTILGSKKYFIQVETEES